MKTYNVFTAGGNLYTTISSTCITKATKSFMKTLPRAAKYALIGQMAAIKYTDDYTIISDYIIYQAG